MVQAADLHAFSIGCVICCNDCQVRSSRQRYYVAGFSYGHIVMAAAVVSARGNSDRRTLPGNQGYDGGRALLAQSGPGDGDSYIGYYNVEPEGLQSGVLGLPSLGASVNAVLDGDAVSASLCEGRVYSGRKLQHRRRR